MEMYQSSKYLLRDTLKDIEKSSALPQKKNCEVARKKPTVDEKYSVLLEDCYSAILYEQAHKYALAGVEELKKLPIYRHKMKYNANGLEDRINRLLHSVEAMSKRYSKEISMRLPYFLKSFIADGFNVYTEEQFRWNKENAGHLQVFYYSCRRALLKRNIDYPDIFTNLMIAQAMIVSAIEIRGVVGGLRGFVRPEPFLKDANVFATGLIAERVGEFDEKEGMELRSALKIIQTKLVSQDEEKRTTIVRVRYMVRYADYVIASLLMLVRKGESFDKDLTMQLHKLIGETKTETLTKELRKSRIAIGAEEAVDAYDKVRNMKGETIRELRKRIMFDIVLDDDSEKIVYSI